MQGRKQGRLTRVVHSVEEVCTDVVCVVESGDGKRYGAARLDEEIGITSSILLGDKVLIAVLQSPSVFWLVSGLAVPKIWAVETCEWFTCLGVELEATWHPYGWWCRGRPLDIQQFVLSLVANLGAP